MVDTDRLCAAYDRGLLYREIGAALGGLNKNQVAAALRDYYADRELRSPSFIAQLNRFNARKRRRRK